MIYPIFAFKFSFLGFMLTRAAHSPLANCNGPARFLLSVTARLRLAVTQMWRPNLLYRSPFRQ